MRFRLEWLGSYLPGDDLDARALAKALTAAGFIGEGIEGEGRDAILDFEVTANRPDGMNHRGLAREAALALSRLFVDEEKARAVVEGETPVETLATVRIEEPELCSRYSARVVEGIRVAGPVEGEKIRERLVAIGANAISGPVDATNHVLWDIGQPMHAFDLDKLGRGEDGRPTIVVRRAREGETLVTLDGVLRTLTPEHLVIADAEKPVALAGVMGGLESAIGPSTTRILLESAHFDPRSVRRTSKALGMHTDASHRFERGTDPATTVEGLERCAALIVKSSGGTVAKGVLDVVARVHPKNQLALRMDRCDAFLGFSVETERAAQILSALGLTPRLEGRTFQVTVPSWRIDLWSEIDLIEEVIRCVGYDQLPETLPVGLVPSHSDPGAEMEDRARDLLAGAGLVEALTYSFISADDNRPFEEVAPGAPVLLANPLGEPFTTMRATPVPGLLRSAQHNVRRGLEDLGLFEIGRSFGRSGQNIRERRTASAVLHGRRDVHISSPGRDVDFFDGSGIVAALFHGLGLGEPTFEPVALPFLAPGRAATVLTSDRRPVGWVGVLTASLAASYDLEDPVVVDLDLGAVPPPPLVTSIQIPSRFPGSEVDLTISHRLELPFRELVAAVREGAPATLLSVEGKSRYRGASVADGFVKTTLNLRYGSAERSLSREEINTWRDEAAQRLLRLPETRVDGIEPPKGSE